MKTSVAEGVYGLQCFCIHRTRTVPARNRGIAYYRCGKGVGVAEAESRLESIPNFKEELKIGLTCTLRVSTLEDENLSSTQRRQ